MDNLIKEQQILVNKMVSIVCGGFLIVQAVYNLIFWKLIKNDYSLIKATLADRYYMGLYGSFKNRPKWNCTMVYTINNKKYRRKIIVEKESPLYYRNYREPIYSICIK